ncbi:Receptor-type tyrosine-protein phosphatase kappa [Gryllus bimaculatus]|nr:Receptor-type tyrosine-protein phosphatase kappa [Gryllus bimaculatus]
MCTDVWQSAAKVETHSCRHAMKPANKEKNQNQKCIPYDYNRVVLDPMVDTPDSDYVNASYVDLCLVHSQPRRPKVTASDCINNVDLSRKIDRYDEECVVTDVSPPCDARPLVCAEPPEAERVHRHAGADGSDGVRLLAHGVAGEPQLHRHAHQDVRLHSVCYNTNY